MEVLVSEEKQEKAEPCRVLIEFASVGSVQVNMSIQGVTPEQLLYLGAYITWHAKRLLEMNEKRQQQPQLILPNTRKPQVTPDLAEALIRGQQ